MPAPLRVGVVGFGKMGLLHASVANGLAISELTAAADPTQGLLESIKRLKPGLAIYEDYEKMLAEQQLVRRRPEGRLDLLPARVREAVERVDAAPAEDPEHRCAPCRHAALP